MEINALRRKKTSKKHCLYKHANMHLFRSTYTHQYMQITLHSADFTGDINVAFDFLNPCLFGHSVYFDYQDFFKHCFRLFISTF